MMIRVLVAVVFPACLIAQEEVCLSPTGDYVLAGDMARAIPEYTAVSLQRILAPSPTPGGKRIFRSDEIRLLAEQSGVKVQSIVDVCFAWPLARLNQSVVLAALRKSFNNPDANIEIAEMTTDRVPQGDLNFPLTGLAVPASLDQPVPVIWRGELAYAGNRRLAIWARVRIDAPVTVVVAVDKLEAGHPITSNQLRTEVRRRFPTLKNTITSIEQIAGMIPLRSLPPGAEVRWGNISRPNYVNRGDIVAIEVRSGTVRLAFTGRAESAGRTGDVIVVRNQETNKTFQARVSAKDKAIVEPGSAKEDGYESR